MTSTLDPRIGTFAAEHVALGLLKFDRRYQTDHHSAQFIDKIAADWLPEKAGAIVASLRRRVPDLSRHDLEPSRGLQDEGGGYYVLDGQARVLAARQAGAESILTVVYRDLDLEQEAEIFDWMNRVRRRPKLMETFRARELYQDPATLDIIAACRESGVEVGPRFGGLPGRIECIRALDSIHAFSPARLREILRMLVKVWPNSHHALSERAVVGLHGFWRRYAETMSLNRLEHVLSLTSPEEMSSLASQYKVIERTSAANAWARVLLQKYNHRLKVGLLDPWRDKPTHSTTSLKRSADPQKRLSRLEERLKVAENKARAGSGKWSAVDVAQTALDEEKWRQHAVGRQSTAGKMAKRLAELERNDLLAENESSASLLGRDPLEL